MPDAAPDLASAADDIVISRPKAPFNTEDWWAVWLGTLILGVTLAVVWSSRPADLPQRLEKLQQARTKHDVLTVREGADPAALKTLRDEAKMARGRLAENPLKPWFAKLSEWKGNDVLAAFRAKNGNSLWGGLAGVWLVSLVLFGLGRLCMGKPVATFPLAFTVLFLLSVLAQVLATQAVIKHYNLEYALWALLVGLVICNTVGTPVWLQSAVQTEFYIKTGLVLLGAEVLFNQLLDLGLPGVFVAWVVTPTVLITTYIFGQKILKMESRSLNMVICADMSVCGVSAAIATGAACKAKKEELSLAIGLSLAFTVIMMIVMPAFIQWVGMSPVLGGAWIGGTIDSTGAVAAAGNMLGPTGLAVAATVKMIQNILIGAVAFGVAVYWVTYVERNPNAPRPGVGEIWSRFPRFILGFVAASILFSLLQSQGEELQAITSTTTADVGAVLRGWFFCFAFVSIGLETNFSELAKYLVGGKPLVLYVCGQALNLALTLFMAWLMFEKVFPNAAASLAQ